MCSIWEEFCSLCLNFEAKKYPNQQIPMDCLILAGISMYVGM